MGDDGVKLVKIGESKIEKFMLFHDLERYNSMNFTQSFSNEIFLNFCITLIEQIYTLNPNCR